MFRWFQIVCLVVGLTVRLQAQEQKEMQLNLDECVQIALGNNSSLVIQKYTVLIAENNVVSARRSFLPNTSNITFSKTQSITGPREGQFFDANTGLIVSALGESTVGGSQRFSVGGIGIPIYNATLFSTLASNKQNLRSSEHTLSNTRQTVIFNAKQAYFQLLTAIKLLESQQEQVKLSEENLRRSEVLQEIGSTAISEVLNARANMANARATLIQRENDVEQARVNLAFQLGLGTDVYIIPTQLDFSVQSLSLSFEEAAATALRESPDMLSRKYGLLATRETLKGLQRSLFHPQVTANGSYSWNLSNDDTFRGVEDLFLKNYSYSFSISATIPLYNIQARDNIKTQKINYYRAMEQLDQAKRQLAQNVQVTFLNIKRLQRSIDASKASVEAQEKAFELAQERYNFGAGTFLELLTGQRDLFQARSNLIQNIYNYQISLAQLQQRLGGKPVIAGQGDE
ncbi:MAG: TolC family protein [bacterium]|nr:TolC family protein [bacterium]